MRKIAVAAATMVAFALTGGSGARADTILDYTFDSGSMVHFNGSDCYSISGTFDYDATTGTAISGTVTEHDVSSCGADSGPYVYAAVDTLDSDTSVKFTDDGYGDSIQYNFDSSFALGGTDDLTGQVTFFDTNGSSNFTDSGSATAPSSAPVPEPASLSLLGMGLIALGVRRRRRHG